MLRITLAALQVLAFKDTGRDPQRLEKPELAHQR